MDHIYHSKKSYVFWTLYSLLFGFFVVFLFINFTELIFKNFSENKNQANVVLSDEKIEVKKEVPIYIPNKTSFVFVGDIMLGRGVRQLVYKRGGGDFHFMFENVGFLKNHDVVFGNLEGSISDKGKDLRNLYSFRFEPESLLALKDAGFNVLSVANNHVGDWGRPAFEDSISRLKEAGIIYVGGGINKTDADIKIIDNNGTKIGFLGFSDVGPNWMEVSDDDSGLSILKEDEIENIVRDASLKVDILIVSIHFGEEYQEKANEKQKEISHTIIDNGAKLVIGHHPHVIQEVEEYNGGLIAYSLGNFIFDQNFSKETMQGLVLEVLFEDKNMISFNKKIFKINDYFQPILETL